MTNIYLKSNTFFISMVLTLFTVTHIYANKDNGWDIDTVKTSLLTYVVEYFSGGYEIPWGMAFLPNGNLLVTDISGKIFNVNQDGQGESVSGVPKVFYKGQGGLLDIEVDPEFEKNKYIYICYSDYDQRKSFTSVARAKLVKDSLKQLKTIFTAPKEYYSRSPYHFGSRLLIKNGNLYFSIGDRGAMKDAQDLKNPSGKIHRIKLDGSIPEDNPFIDKNGQKTSVWTYGNRNPQGLAIDSKEVIWELEHGPKGGDELNIIIPGKNYGWPLITYGINYDGTSITDKTHMKGMEQPIWHWTPSIAVCGMKFYYGKPFDLWDGNILVTSLKFEYLARVVVNDRVYIDSEIIYEPGSRVRDVEIGPNGHIYVALENPGRIVKLRSITYNSN